MDVQHRSTPPQSRVSLDRHWAQVDLGNQVARLDRLWAKVQIGAPDECWPFVGARAKGYGRIARGGAKGGVFNAHRIVAEDVIGVPAEKADQVRHLCGFRACCNPRHLAWGDQSANEMDKVLHGRSNRGERHGMHKITREQVREIRLRCQAGESQRQVALDFGIAPQSVSEIVTRRTWAWFVDEEGGDAK